MKIYFYLSILFLVVACSKEKDTDEVDNPASVTPPCTNNWVKSHEGHYKIKMGWLVFDSINPPTVMYDTVLMDCHLLYRDCNVLYYQERKVSFAFDSTLMSTVNLSTTPGWTDFITLSLDTVTDSIFMKEEVGHLGRSFTFYAGRRE